MVRIVWGEVDLGAPLVIESLSVAYNRKPQKRSIYICLSLPHSFALTMEHHLINEQHVRGRRDCPCCHGQAVWSTAWPEPVPPHGRRAHEGLDVIKPLTLVFPANGMHDNR